MGEKVVAIIGGGTFGLQALQWTSKKHFRAVVFDADPNAPVRKYVHALLSPAQGWSKMDFIQAPSILVLGDALEVSVPILQEIQPALVIPTIPVHYLAAALVLVARKKNITFIPDPEEISWIGKQFMAPLNTSIKPAEGIITLSYAQPGEICPPHCAGPKDYCPTFHRKKEQSVTQLVRVATSAHSPVFIAESQQLTKGLGGIPGTIFFDHLMRFQSKFPSKFIVATTCNCHGVLHALKRSS